MEMCEKQQEEPTPDTTKYTNSMRKYTSRGSTYASRLWKWWRPRPDAKFADINLDIGQDMRDAGAMLPDIYNGSVSYTYIGPYIYHSLLATQEVPWRLTCYMC